MVSEADRRKEDRVLWLKEPDAGSDPSNIQTVALEKGDHWILNGAKYWITNGSISDIAVVWAKVDGYIRGFVVEKDTQGFTSGEIKHKVSLRSFNTAWHKFKDCALPKGNILP